MTRHISPEHFITLPSGNRVHPCRLIHKDGTVMWRHAINGYKVLEQSHEAHIIKTAQRIEELNSWISQGLEPWDCLIPMTWYVPQDPTHGEGISVYFEHQTFNSNDTYKVLKQHVLEHERLEVIDQRLFFSRC